MNNENSGVPQVPKQWTSEVIPAFAKIPRSWNGILGIFVARIISGEYYVTRADEAISTVLGSCISACLWDDVAKVGGINHFKVPGPDPAARAKVGSKGDLNHGEFAMESLLSTILANGGRLNRLKARIVGGGRILDIKAQIGEANIQFVRRFLRAKGIPILEEDVGLTYPRVLMFYPRSGLAQVRRLRTLDNESLAALAMERTKS